MSGCIQVTELTWEVAVEKELNAMLADGNVRNLNRFSEYRFGDEG